MIFATSFDGKLTSYGESDMPPMNAEVFDSWEDLWKKYPEYKVYEDKKKRSILNNKNRAFAHVIKAQEAYRVLHMDGKDSKAVPYLSAWADTQGISLKKAAEIVWSKHLKGVEAETERTKAKDETRD